MAARAPEPVTANPGRVEQMVPAELYNRFFAETGQGGQRGEGVQGELSLNTLQRGMADNLYGRSRRGAEGFTASYVDDVARYMESKQKQRALEEKASSAPIAASTNTVQESLLNAPASPKTAPTSVADELLRRKIGRITGR
jgi:hypothetical protein